MYKRQVLEKEKRASDTAKLYVTGRDTPYQEYTLRFRDCRWELVERKTQEQLAKETIPDVLFRLVNFMRDKEEWAGTATELLAAMRETETIPTVITKWLNEYRTTFLSENRICYQYSRRKDGTGSCLPLYSHSGEVLLSIIFRYWCSASLATVSALYKEAVSAAPADNF